MQFRNKDFYQIYQKIVCSLYEDHDGVEKKISSFGVMKDVSLEEYLKNVRISVDNYSFSCNNMLESELFLEITATMESNKEVVYKIPITLIDNSCMD